MTELKDDLDRALRSVTFGEAPVQRAMRDGRRLRNRRRLTAAAGAVAIVAVAAGYPALTRNAATPLPATSRTASPTPSHTASGPDPVIKDGPPPAGAAKGMIAQGTVGGAHWSVVISNIKGQPDEVCNIAYLGSGSSVLRAQPADQVTSMCATNMETLISDPAPDPAGITGGTGSVSGSTTTYETGLGEVAPDVTYLSLDFTDGQQLKLIPVTYQGHRYVAWLAPTSMTVARLTAHLGSAHADSGQIWTAIPYNTPVGVPLFGLWLKPGQSVPPRASGVIGGGTHDGQVWSESAYAGPWGTCFSATPGDMYCLRLAGLGTTEMLGGWGGNPVSPAFGSAAPDVARLRITLSNGTAVQVTPVAIGNERLFAFWAGKGVSPTGWTAYDAKGHKIGSHTMAPYHGNGTVVTGP
jgi:hypothetical protein